MRSTTDSHEFLRVFASLRWLLVFLLMMPGSGYAERKYTFGTNCDFMGGASNQIGSSSLNLSQLQKGTTYFYSVYPSLTLKSVGQHSTLDLNYTFVGERYQMSPALTTTSHAFTGNFTSQVGKRARLRLSDTFNTVPDFSTINVLQGFTYTPQGFQYVFQPELTRRSSISNAATAGLDIDLSKKSFLTFAASGSYRHYEGEVAIPGYLSDQIRIEGSLGYSHRHSPRQTWTLRYIVYQNDFKHYYNVRSHAATLGLTRVVRPTLNLTLEAGPAYTEKTQLQKEYVGYSASATISKLVHANRFYLNYSHRSGDSTGLGLVTDSDQGGLGFALALARRTSLNFDASGFKQKQKSSNAYDYSGVRGSLALQQNLGDRWVISIGGSYQTYLQQQAGTNNLAYKRVYLSFGYRIPELWRVSK
ncbi:MAG TPA: hypothetical protein VE398_02040 [Acidobacteriota bacterium]|nr:hypothetical protein [Acidobacteriota bacterium]